MMYVLAYMVAVTTVCCYTQLYQTTHSTLITVEPKLVVLNLCNHISVQGKWLVLFYLEVSLGYRG